jgi:AAHS family 3-hydroxyphenylpropionic acid transporter
MTEIAPTLSGDQLAPAVQSRAWLTVSLCCLAAMAEGYDIQSMGVAAPGMAPALRLTRDQLGPAFSASTVGLLIGAILIGALADRIGRKWALVGSLAVFGAFTLATPLAADLPMLLAIRTLAGLGLGGAMPNFIALASESVAARRRATFVAIAGAAMPFGGAIASAVAARFDWRTIFEVGGAAPLALAALMTLALPESQRFLAARRNRGPASAGAPSVLSSLFGERRALPGLLLWIACFAALLTLFLLLNWLPILMAAKGVSKPDASIVSLAFNTAGAGGALSVAVLFRGQRRAPTVAVWFVGMTVGTVLLALTPARLELAAAAGLVAGFFISSAPTALYAIAPDFYPVEMRGTGLGATIGVGRGGGIAGPLVAGALLAAGKDANGVLMVLPFVVVVGAAAALWVVRLRPRTPVG